MPRAPLLDAPWDAVDRSTRLPRYGSYRGALRKVELDVLVPDAFERLARHKRWVWGMVGTKEHAITFAIVDLGYVTSAFGYAWSATEGMLVDHAVLGPPGLAAVERDDVDRVRARFKSVPGLRRARLSVREPVGEDRIAVEVSLPSLTLSGQADLTRGPSPMTAVAKVERGIVNVTEKRVLTPFTGAALVGGRRISLGDGDGAFFAWDVTDGFLARKTRWKWALTQGRLDDGAPFAFNLVEGFVGAPECTLWIDGRPVPIDEGQFTFDAAAPRSPWTVTSGCGTVRLEVTPTATHEDAQDLRVIRSRFVQAIGMGRGVITHEGTERRFERAVSVVEDQDMVW